MIPLFHDFSDKRVVIVGGGRVALRRARTFAKEADVTVIAPSFHDAFRDVDCRRISERVTPDAFAECASGAYLAIPATDDANLNAALATVARREGCLVNRIDTVGEVVVPSRIDSAEVTVAISTGGSSPAMSKRLRHQITPILRRSDRMVRLQRDVRAELKREIEEEAKRTQLLWRILESDEIRDLLETDYEAALRETRDIVESGR